jgi:hypothetical protein
MSACPRSLVCVPNNLNSPQRQQIGNHFGMGRLAMQQTVFAVHPQKTGTLLLPAADGRHKYPSSFWVPPVQDEILALRLWQHTTTTATAAAIHLGSELEEKTNVKCRSVTV